MPTRTLARRLLLLAGIACASRVPAQSALPTLQEDAWTTSQGLPQNSVHALAQTSDGFLWVATESGLARFDGAQFRIYTAADLGPTASEDLCCLAVDTHNTLWIGSSLGLAALRDSRILALPQQPPFTGNRIRSLRAEADGVLVATDGASFHVRLDPSGPAATPAPPSSLPDSALPAHLRAPDGTLWSATPHGLATQAPGSPAPTPTPWLRNDVVLSLLEDREGDLWIGTEASGLHRLRRSVFSTWPSTAGLAVTAVAHEANGTVVVATRAGDLLELSPTSQQHLLAHLDAAITALQTNATSTWVGTTDGLYRFGPHAARQRYTSADGLPDDYIRSLALAPDGSAWVGTPHGLAHIAGGRITPLGNQSDTGGGLIGAILWTPPIGSQPEGLWIATESGLAPVTADRIGPTLPLRDGSHSSVPAALAYDPRGALWAATQDGGLWILRNGSFVKAIQLPSGRSRQQVQSLFIDSRGTLWIMLRDGLLSGSAARLAACTPATCRSLTGLVTTWQIGDGLPSTESISPGFDAPIETGPTILFPTRAGLAAAAAGLAGRAGPIPVTIEHVLLEDREFDPSALQHLPFGRTRLTFDYAGVSLAQPSHVRYRVRLQGFDPGWIEAGTRRSATYTSLPAGQYTFLVQATLEGQPWSSATSFLAFRVDPPFYQRWEFALCLLCLLAAVLFVFYRLRLRAERRHFALIMEERNRLAREVHDTLAQDLVSTGIQLDVALFALSGPHPQQATDMLRTLRRRVAQALTEARESIGELRDPELRLDLLSRLHRLADRKATTTTAIHVHADSALPPLPPGVERELLRILGEAIANALKHADSSRIEIAVQASNAALTLTTHDNGRGFDPAAALPNQDHYGLRGMQERADAIGATLAIASRPGDGTTVTVTLRYPQ